MAFLSPPLRAAVAPIVVVSVLASAGSVEAGGFFKKHSRAVVPTATTARIPDNAGYPMLGTFYPEPYMMVRGNGVAGNGYSPLDQFGPNTLALDGPLSPLRATAAPVLTYTRGYDGAVRPLVGTSFSYPNFPRFGPVVYPTRANVSPGFRTTSTPPWWNSAINWIDQN
jgi:hypothetical protein